LTHLTIDEAISIHQPFGRLPECMPLIPSTRLWLRVFGAWDGSLAHHRLLIVCSFDSTGVFIEHWLILVGKRRQTLMRYLRERNGEKK
jgi:hypothetical protein